MEASGSALGHVDKVLITTCLGSRGLEKKIVVYISPENMGDFLAIVKEKNFIEVVSRSINQVFKDDITNVHFNDHLHFFEGCDNNCR